MRCPICSAEVPRLAPEEVLQTIRLTPTERTIAYGLVEKFGRSVRHERILHLLYGDNSDGGPLDARGVLRTTISHLRKRLKPVGLVIVCPEHGCYQMLWEDSDCATRIKRI